MVLQNFNFFLCSGEVGRCVWVTLYNVYMRQPAYLVLSPIPQAVFSPLLARRKDLEEEWLDAGIRLILPSLFELSAPHSPWTCPGNIAETASVIKNKIRNYICLVWGVSLSSPLNIACEFPKDPVPSSQIGTSPCAKQEPVCFGYTARETAH